MQETPAAPNPEAPQPARSPWRVAGWVCAGVIVVSVVACIVMASIRSTGLTQITVTALDEASEPRDHNLPLVKQKEALPDYEVIVLLSSGERIRLGAKPDTSAVEGLSWRLNNPVSVADVASVRLQEQDKVISDAIAEVQILGTTATSKGYRFEFATERSMGVGVESFFGTPIGRAITAGFCIAVLVVILVVGGGCVRVLTTMGMRATNSWMAPLIGSTSEPVHADHRIEDYRWTTRHTRVVG